MKYLKWSALLLFVLAGSVFAQVKVGDSAPDFKLKSSLGKEVTLASNKGKWVVLEWTNYDCPFVKKFYSVGKMQELQKKYTDQGVVWFQVNSSAPTKQGNFPAEEIVKLSAERKTVSTAYLIDEYGSVGKAYGAKTTPHFFIINPEGKVVYAGGIDSIKSAEPSDIPKAENYVQKALDEGLAGKPITTAETTPYGCSVKY